MWTAVEVLSRWIGIEHLRLGGGTALEARWHHRSSTDLDFFTLSEHADIVFYERLDEMTKDLTELALTGTISNRDIRLVQRKILHFRVGDTPVSWGSTELLHDDPRDEVEHQTGVFLSGNKDILAKKLDHRLVGNQLATERDAYDFAVARTEAPDDLAYAWDILPTHKKTTVVDVYAELAAAGWQEARHRDRLRPLVGVRHEGIAVDLWAHVHRMFESDLTYTPPLTRGGPDGGNRTDEHGHR